MNSNDLEKPGIDLCSMLFEQSLTTPGSIKAAIDLPKAGDRARGAGPAIS